ncbi:MAG: SDR family NAD(P)-dependent oxidoreductase [Methylobacteriaceae bacterium]|jgi:NAD(P)-dependent dehydrogenase (short-subunit alcohol dehydrogenase family)|nr:SDR family NAD(P)-dependent oxidoreductase [Methylobacteriaceae bacterium]
MKPLENRIAVVTGASRGIGAAAASALAAAGAHVITVARSAEALEQSARAIEAAGGVCTPFPADITRPDAVAALAKMVGERFGRLDMLFGNAGALGGVLPVTGIDDAVWQATFAVNVTANFLLLKALDGLLRRSDAGRVLFVSSGAAWKANPRWGVYSVSKAALEVLARTYAAEVADTPVKVMLLSPGPIRTGMRAEAVPGEDPNTLKTPEDLAPHIVRLLSPDWPHTGKIYDFPAGGVVKNPGVPQAMDAGA